MKEKIPEARYSMDLFCVDKWGEVHFFTGGIAVVRSEDIIPTLKSFGMLEAEWSLSSVRVTR